MSHEPHNPVHFTPPPLQALASEQAPIQQPVELRLPLVKRDHWDRHLTDWADTMAGKSWVWGSVDCTCLATGAIAAMTGIPETDLRAYALDGTGPNGVGVGTYSSRRGALQLYRRLGGTRVGLERLGLYERPGGIQFAQRGDLILSPTEPFASVFVSCDWRMLGANENDRVQWYLKVQAVPGSIVLRF